MGSSCVSTQDANAAADISKPINIQMRDLHVTRCCQGKLEVLTIKVCNELLDTL